MQRLVLRSTHARDVRSWRPRWVPAVTGALALTIAACTTNDRAISPAIVDSTMSEALNVAQVERGRDIFRFDTFGDETFWTDTLRMHEVIRESVSPATALAVGLKVDIAALPPWLIDHQPDLAPFTARDFARAIAGTE